VASQSDVSRSGALLLAEAGFADLGRVVKWMAERTEPTADNSAISVEDLHNRL